MADMKKIKDLFQKLVSCGMSGGDVDKVNDNIEKVEKIIEIVLDVFGDGLQLSDITALGKAVAPAMVLAKGFDDYDGADKKRFVTELVWLVYRTVDTYPDGNGNNINVPWAFGGIETRIERFMVTFAAGMAVDALYGRMKKEGEV